MKKEWVLNQDAFRQFLHWLDEGVDSGGDKYIEMRRRLVSYFDRRNCPSPDELADETLNRVARKLEELGQITDASPPHYCYIVARFILLEFSRSPQNRQSNIDDISPSQQAKSRLSVSPFSDSDALAKEKRMNCLEGCLGQLPARDQAIIVEYYRGELRSKLERRAQIAENLGITLNALSVRTCRIRTKLETCVKKCCDDL